MEIQKFSSPSDMIQYLKGLKPSDHFKLAKSIGIKPNDKAEARLYADYIVQGANKGFTGDALVAYAKANVPRIQAIMPHLKEKPQVPSVAKPKAKLVVSQVGNTKVGSVVKTKAPKVTKPKKVKYADFTIVHRADRNGYEGWYGGKAEAFRPTVEKVQAFFQKKYGQSGKLV